MAWWYCPAGVQGTVLGIAVDFERPTLYAPPDFLGPHRGDFERRKQRFGVFLVGKAGRSQKRASSLPWPGLSVRKAGRSRKRASSPPWPGLPVGEAGRSWKRTSSPPWPGLPVGDWIALPARR